MSPPTMKCEKCGIVEFFTDPERDGLRACYCSKCGRYLGYKKPNFKVKTTVQGRELVAGVYEDKEYAEKVARVLTEGSMSNPRAMCTYWVEEVY